MPKRTNVSPVIDAMLQLIAVGGLTAAAILAPNALMLFDKPIRKYFDKVAKEKRSAELRRLFSYAKHQGLIKESYRHGLSITSKAAERLARLEIDKLHILKPHKWDRDWRIIFYDIPEQHKSGRDALTSKLKELGCYQLQRSVWVHPYPCRNVISAICITYGIEQYVTYMKSSFIDNQAKLIEKFGHLGLR